MLKIRLKRVGRKHDPSFRLVVVESTRGPKSGHYVENLGSYDARTNVKNINTERATYWLGVGAEPSDTAHNLLIDAGVMTGNKVNVLPKKTPIKKEGGEEEKSSAVNEEESTSEKDTPAEVAQEVVAGEDTPEAVEEVVAEEAVSANEEPVEAPEEEAPAE